MAIQQRRPANLYLTFKVIQLVNRLKNRVSGCSTRHSLLGSKTCLGLESKALRSIQKGLPRASAQGRKHLQQLTNRICKNRKNIRPALKLETGRRNAVNPNTSAGELRHVLRSLDQDGNISPQDNALSAVCSDNKLFLQSGALNLDACSLDETIQSLVLVYEAINVLYAARTQYDDQFIITQGSEIGLSIDESFIANYEHLLLCLQSQLIETLTRKVVEALLANDLDKTQRKLLNWFTEFPDNRHPLSTTWPWSIKPSLAVLWGVCWMFYNNNSSGEKNNGERIPQARFLHEEQLRGWNAPQPNEYFNFGLALTGTQSQLAAPQPVGGDDSGVGGGARDWPLPDLSTQASARAGPSRATQPLWAPDLPGGPGPTSTRSTYYPQAIPRTGQDSIINFSLPGNSGIATTVFAFPQQFDNVEPWQQQQYTQRPSTNLPQRQRPQPSHLRVPDVPGIRVSADSESFAPPQADFSYLYEQSPQQLNINTNLSTFGIPQYTNMGASPLPEPSPIQTTQVIRHERTPSVNSNTNMPTPVSLGAPRSPLLSPVGDRRHSNASLHGHIGHVRHRSEDSISSQDGDLISPRRNNAYKRAEEPPRNQDGKMVCKHKECANITFDRKCEWSKHMDKHDRPYKCAVKGCEKLQGFTYSGGLLRHEREVHKMHGGTKKSLFCPFPDCKRSSGSGFTRKENLAEHIRRVHRRSSTSADLGHMVIPRSDTGDEATEVHLAPESPYQRTVELSDDFTLKRKRMSDAGASEDGDETDLRAEVKRLRRENEEKNSRLRQLEAAVMALQQSQR